MDSSILLICELSHFCGPGVLGLDSAVFVVFNILGILGLLWMLGELRVTTPLYGLPNVNVTTPESAEGVFVLFFVEVFVAEVFALVDVEVFVVVVVVIVVDLGLG